MTHRVDLNPQSFTFIGQDGVFVGDARAVRELFRAAAAAAIRRVVDLRDLNRLLGRHRRHRPRLGPAAALGVPAAHLPE